MELIRILAQNRYLGPLLACLGIAVIVLVFNIDTIRGQPSNDIGPKSLVVIAATIAVVLAVLFFGTRRRFARLNFQAERVAGSILGMGDVVGLVEKAAEQIDQEEAEAMAKKLIKGRFTLDDMLQQLGQIKKMGDMEGLLGMLPGVGKIKNQLKEANVNDKMIARQEAIILSMTQKERENSKILNGSRRRRIAAGAGTTVQEVNRLLKQYKQMTLMMKKMGKKGKRGLMGGMGGMMPGMMPPMPPIR